jgi:hypothetical protein
VPLALLGIHDPLEEMQLLLLVLGERPSFTRTTCCCVPALLEQLFVLVKLSKAGTDPG